MTGPDPDTVHPLPEHPRVVFLRPLAKGRSNVTVGRYAYYDDPEHALAFFERNVLHHDFLGDHLTIGAFTAIAVGARIVMNGANHDPQDFSTFPFDIFPGWASFDAEHYRRLGRSDTVIGPDVRIAAQAWIMPGVTIGAGAIVATAAVVSRDVPPFAVVAGNPARVVRHRFEPNTARRLLEVAWWDWPAEKIGRNLDAIRGRDVGALEAAT